MAGKSDQVYEGLRQDILTGALRPGESLSAVAVGTRFDASRTPVRQAFLRLESEGLVSLVDRQGARVAPISIQNVRDLFELRILLEGAAHRSVAEDCAHDRAAHDEFAGLLTGFEAVAVEEHAGSRRTRFYELTEAFDQAVVRHLHNRHLARTIADLRPHSDRLRNIAHSVPERLDLSLDEHLTMVRAVVAHDGAAAELACTEHLTRTRTAVLDAVLDPRGKGDRIDVVTA
ncbi:GntR family transcriptional regulator [Rhodococcus triatomae]